MSKRVEEYIENYTNRCSNEVGSALYREIHHLEPEYSPWLTPDQARRAVEIAREEMVERTCDAYCKVCGHYAHKTPTYICRQACDYYKDFKQAIKDE